ncbi:MAG TPA: hypothetical protein VFW09_14440 [Solirubrobacteraceae bacterium]|nr:hypothetical protein [Solirubrobacteraceae bacterium]
MHDTDRLWWREREAVMMPTMGSASSGGRGVTAIVVAAVVLAMLALVLSYAGRSVLRSGTFADRTVHALPQPAVRDEVADRLTNAVVHAGSGDLATVRPLVRAVAGSVVSSPAFAALLRRAVIEAHAAVVQRDRTTMFATVADAGVLLQGVLQRLAPDAAKAIGAERAQRLLTVRPGAGLLDVVRAARAVYALAWLFGAVAALLGAAAIWRSRARRRTIRQLGSALAMGAMALVVAYVVGAAVAAQLAPSGQGPVAAALWRAFLGGLQVEALYAAAAGVIVAAAASSTMTPARLARVPGAAWQQLTGERVAGERVAGSLALVAIGIGILLEPGPAVRVLVLALGLFVLYRGVAGALGWARARAAAAVASGRGQVARAARLLRFAPLVLGVAVLAAAVAVIATGGGDEAPAATTPATCNGHVALCARPLNDVSFATTHNSYASVTIPTYLFGQQDGTIADQLGFGIRGLMLDTYYGDKVDGRVRTDLESLPKREAAVDEIGAPAVDAAVRIRSRLQRGGPGTRGIYLCHGLCELGAVSLSSALSDIRSFLVSHPGAVMIVINQDEGVAPNAIARAFERAGLLHLIYRGPLGPFPTLRRMIDSDRRLVVMAENDAGDIPWYHLAYAHALQETPYRFTNPAALTDPERLDASCRPNRGPRSAPLFLLNHWIDTTPTPRASNAAIVNARNALLARARRCEQVRHRLPNLVAVDFYRRGDVLGVVDALNGVGAGR